MKKYLQNDLVEFIPLFNIDYNNKKNLLCGVFFKVKESYKNFNIYIDNLHKLYNFIINNYNNYQIRLFIDNNIYILI